MALLPLLTIRRTWNLLKSILFFLFRTGRTTEVPPFLILTVTSDCNYNCVMCLKTSSIQSGHIDYSNPEEMEFDAIKSFLEEHRKDLFFVRVHGGEPLSYSKSKELIKLLNYLKLPYDIVTNGSLMNSDVIDELVGKYCVNISISLDAASPEIYSSIRKGGNINQISNNIQEINKKKKELNTIRPILNASMCVFKFNLMEITGLIRFSSVHGIDSLSVAEGVNYGTESITNEDLVKNNRDETFEQIKSALKIAKETGVKLRLKFPSLKSSKYDTLPFHDSRILPKDCLNLYSSVWFTPNFNMIGCSSAKYPFGNLSENGFSEIWNGSSGGYRTARESFAKGKVPDSCIDCIYSGGFFS